MPRPVKCRKVCHFPNILEFLPDVYKRQVVGSALHVKVGSVFLVVANQEREKEGLSNPVVHNTDKAVRVAVEALRRIIHENV